MTITFDNEMDLAAVVTYGDVTGWVTKYDFEYIDASTQRSKVLVSLI